MADKTSGAERDVRRILAEAGVAAIDDLRGQVAALEARLAAAPHPGHVARTIETMLDRVLAGENPGAVVADYQWEHGHGPDLSRVAAVVRRRDRWKRVAERLRARLLDEREVHEASEGECWRMKAGALALDLATLKQAAGEVVPHLEEWARDLTVGGFPVEAAEVDAALATLRAAMADQPRRQEGGA